MTSDLLVNRENKEKLFLSYVKVLYRTCKNEGINPACVHPLNRGIYTVFNEVQADLSALRMRRSLKNGVSSGKIAGILAFRLNKTPVFSLSRNINDHPSLPQLQANAALALAFELAGINSCQWSEQIIRELKYFLCKRHCNQESLSLCLDIMSNSTPKNLISSD